MKQKLGPWSIALPALAALVLAVSGCTQQFETSFNAGKGGELVVIQKADPSTISRVIKIADNGPTGMALMREVFVRRDYLFVVTYEVSFKSTSPLGEITGRLSDDVQPFDLMIEVPGRITSTTADSVTGNRAVWRMAPGKSLDIQVSSRSIRLWPIIIPVLLVLVLLFRRYRRK